MRSIQPIIPFQQTTRPLTAQSLHWSIFCITQRRFFQTEWESLAISNARKKVTKLKKRASEGSAEALNDLGHHYDTGRGVPKDHKKALLYFTKAADLGLPRAFYNLGICYYHGKGVASSRTVATIHFEEAVEKEDLHATYSLAFCHEHGHGVPKNLAKAIAFYQIAAEKGHAKASQRLRQFKTTT